MEKRYQVFVSSTYADLQEERRSIIQTLIQMDCIPAGMELFPAVDEEQFSFIKRIIDDCDYYLLIIAGRYGSVAPDGVSYTEMEYEYAREKGLKVLAFVHEKPDTIAFGKSESDPDRRAKLDAFKRKAMASTVAKLWVDPKELPGLVAISLQWTIKLHPAIGWVRANQVANTEVLAELNQIRKAKDELEVRIRKMTPEITHLAGLEDKVELSGTYTPRNYAEPYHWSLEITWGQLFAAVGPYMIENPNDMLMHSYFNDVVQHLCVAKNKYWNERWTLDPKLYQSFKVQMMALKMVDVEMLEAVNGGQALFWSLSALGHATLLQLRSAKKKAKE